MDPYGDPWGAPFPYYQPLSSFVAPATPPAGGPGDAPLVSLPLCINRDWLRLLIGAADSLRSPGNWPGLTESDLRTTLERVDALKGMLGQWGGCVNPVTSLSYDCAGLVAHFADGSTAPVPGWVDNFCNCVRGCIPPPVTTPPGRTDDQAACNVANWLAGEVIQGALLAAANQLQISSDLTALAAKVSDFLSGVGYVWTGLFSSLIVKFSQDSIAATLSHLEFAATDPVLKSDLTCAIFNAIRGSNSVNASNLASVVANICGISYAYSDITTIVCNFASGLGLTGWEGLQPTGSFIDADCSGCGTYCRFFDFTAGMQGWTVLGGFPGVYTAGVGFQTQQQSAIQDGWFNINFPSPTFVTTIDVCVTTGNSGGLPAHRRVNCYLGGTNVAHPDLSTGHVAACSRERVTINHTIDEVLINYGSPGNPINPDTVCGVAISGNGANIFGSNNCLALGCHS